VIARLGGRKFIVVMFSLIAGTYLALKCDAAIVAAFANLASICVGAFMLSHAAADWKNGKATP
jgi:hypothetical protein